MFKFTAYFDASADAKNTVTTVAGFVARVHKWESFEDQWRKLLPKNVSSFHMTDFASYQNGWESWKGQESAIRRSVLFEKLVDCIKKTTNKGFTASLRSSDWQHCNRQYKLREHYAKPYVILSLGCLGRLDKWARKKGIPKKNILCIFEDGDAGQGRLFEMAKAEGFNIISQSKEQIRAFDACDLAAWKARRVVDDRWEKELEQRGAPILESESTRVSLCWES